MVVRHWLSLATRHGLSLRNLSGANAASASEQGFWGAIHDGLYLPQVRLPAALGHVMGMTDPVSGDGTFSANVASACHWTSQEQCLVPSVQRLAGPVTILATLPAACRRYSHWLSALIADSKMFIAKTPAH